MQYVCKLCKGSSSESQVGVVRQGIYSYKHGFELHSAFLLFQMISLIAAYLTAGSLDVAIYNYMNWQAWKTCFIWKMARHTPPWLQGLMSPRWGTDGRWWGPTWYENKTPPCSIQQVLLLLQGASSLVWIIALTSDLSWLMGTWTLHPHTGYWSFII